VSMVCEVLCPCVLWGRIEIKLLTAAFSGVNLSRVLRSLVSMVCKVLGIMSMCVMGYNGN